MQMGWKGSCSTLLSWFLKTSAAYLKLSEVNQASMRNYHTTSSCRKRSTPTSPSSARHSSSTRSTSTRIYHCGIASHGTLKPSGMPHSKPINDGFADLPVS